MNGNFTELTGGERILIHRTRSGLSRKQFAAMLGCSVNTVANYEKGISQPDVNTLVKISDILGISIDLLLLDPQDKPNGGFKPILTKSPWENGF